MIVDRVPLPAARRPWRPRRLVRPMVAILLALLPMLVVAPASSSAAHASVVETYPADGAVLAGPPAEVAVIFDTMPVTAQGDPLSVHRPTGGRIDTADVRLASGQEDGLEKDSQTALSVSLSADEGFAAGSYEVVYRVISADMHLVAGSFSFEISPDGSGGAGEAALSSPLGSGAEPGADGWSVSGDSWPKVLVAALGSIALALWAIRRSVRTADGRSRRV